MRRTLTGKHRDQNIVLYGQRRTGKTSVLYQMNHTLDERYLCILIDLQSFVLESLDGFLWELAVHVQQALKEDYEIKVFLPDQEEFLTNAWDQFIGDFLNQLLSATGERHILFMLDEIERLQAKVKAGNLKPDLYDYLRHLMQHYERLSFLFSIGAGLEEMEKNYNLLFNVAIHKKISFLETDAARSLIIEPVEDYYKVDKSTVDYILDITSGHPYYIQLICHSIFNRWQKERQKVIGIDEVNAVLEEVVERGDFVFKYVWGDSDKAEKAVMVGMAAAIGDSDQPVSTDEIIQIWAEHEVLIPIGEVDKAIESLAAREVIVEDGGVRFTVALTQLWLRKQKRLSGVKIEITDKIQEWHKSRISRRIWQAIGVFSLLLVTILILTGVFFPSLLSFGRFTPTPISISSDVSADGVELRVDSDGDGLSDDEELELGTLPQERDSDADGLDDYSEVKRFETDPLKSDTDGDGKTDSLETSVDCLDPKNSDSDGDGVLDNIDLNPCATSTPTPTASNTPSPSPSPTQKSTPTSTIEPTPTITPEPTSTLEPVPTTPLPKRISTTTNTPVISVTQNAPTAASDETNSAVGPILLTTQNRIYSMGINGENPIDHGAVRNSTCGTEAQTALGDVYEIYLGPYCGIGGTGAGSCRSPNGLYEVITGALSLSETTISIRPVDASELSFVFQGSVDRGEGIRWSPRSDQFLFVAGDTVYAASLDGSYDETIRIAYSPQFSPSGSMILYTKPVDPGVIDVFVTDADGKNTRRVTTASFVESPCPRWRLLQ